MIQASQPLILLLFVGSGAAALIYEIIWFQLLQLVIGSSAISLGVLLGTFMGGMCLGSLLLPRVVPRRHHPLRVYAVLELAIGAIGILVLQLMPLLGGLYLAWGGYGFMGFTLRGVVAALCLLPPTLLMGATLPAVGRWVESTPTGMSWLGFFYGGNIAGAVFGSLLAGFYLLRVHDMATATFAAAAINGLVGALALALAAATRYQAADETASTVRSKAPDASSDESGTIAVYAVIALSGLCALAAEVIWTRTLSLLFGPSVYTFSIILAVFLVGLGIGSSAGSFLARNIMSPRAALGWCQLMAAAAIAWAAYMLAESLPYWPINPSIASNIRFTFQLDLARAFWTMLPATLLWGASFPLALAAVAHKGRDPGRLVGGVYAANTLGAILGAMGASLLLVAWIGSQNTQRLLIALSAVSGMLALGPIALRHPAAARRAAPSIPLAGGMVVAAFLVATVPPPSRALVAYGRNASSRAEIADILYMGEGVNSSVAVSLLPSGVMNYHNAGKIQASSEPQDMRLQRMLGHLTTLVPERPRSVVVIGCGAGVTAGAVSLDPLVERVTIVEIEPLVPRVVSEYFSVHNNAVLANPKVEVVIDDARHFMLTTDETFDAITSDPLDPWVKGAAALYTAEFLHTVKSRLNPGGVVTLFVQLYESTPDAVKSEVATFFEVFPNGAIWGNLHEGQGYDMVLMGQVEPLRIDVDRVQERLNRSAEVAYSLSEVDIPSALELFATYGGRGSDLTEWLSGAQINRDRNLRLQYLAGVGLNTYSSAGIYLDILAHRRFPEDLFTGTPARLQFLRDRLEPRGD